MRAIVIATGVAENGGLLNERMANVMLPLVDRPFIQHVVESLVSQGADQIDFILSHLPDQIERLLGNGVRWGANFRFHLSRDPERPYATLANLPLPDETEPILFAHADRLPGAARANIPSEDVIFVTKPSDGVGQPAWVGWARLRASSIRQISAHCDFGRLEEMLRGWNVARYSVENCLRCQTYEDLLIAEASVLNNASPELLLNGREQEPGVRVAGSADVSPRARINAPVYLGENCRVLEGAVVGPNAVVCNDTVLDRRCSVVNSVVCPGTYVGEELDLEDVIADKDCLTNVRLQAGVQISDEFVLGDILNNHTANALQKQFTRFLAGILLLLFWPILAACMLHRRWVFSESPLYRKASVKLPTAREPAGWRTFDLLSVGRRRPRALVSHFVFKFVPALWNVVKGDLELVGLPARSNEEIHRLPSEWQSLYLQGKAGLVTEEIARHGINASVEERYAAELFYLATHCPTYDLSLLATYLRKVISDCFRYGLSREHKVPTPKLSEFLFPGCSFLFTGTARDDRSGKNGHELERDSTTKARSH